MSDCRHCPHTGVSGGCSWVDGFEVGETCVCCRCGLKGDRVVVHRPCRVRGHGPFHPDNASRSRYSHTVYRWKDGTVTSAKERA